MGSTATRIGSPASVPSQVLGTVFLLGFLFFLVLPTTARAQEGVIAGTVQGPDGEPVSASVQVVGTGIGVLADENGAYRLDVPVGTHRVRAQALGYAPVTREVEVQAGQRTNLDFTLEVSAVRLQEVVASVEAGQVRRSELGTDIASIDAAAEVDKGAVTDLSSLLNARAGNVTVSQTSGNVGGGSRIRVRGINSLFQDNNPLLIIDGIRANQDTGVGINRGQTFSRFNDISPQDIKSIEVVKGPSATALYGSEAASGVIIIETKEGRGSGGTFRLTVKGEAGFQQDVSEYRDNYADVTEFVTGADDSRLAPWPVTTNPFTGQVFVTDNPFEDADSSPFRTARLANGHVAARGAVDQLSYYSSVRYQNDTGVLPSNDLEKLSLRTNFSASPGEVVQLDASAGYTSSSTNLPKSGGNTSGFFANAEDGIPMSALGTDGSCLATVLAGTDPSFCDKNGNTRAAFDKIGAIISRQDVERFTGSVIATVEPLSWLTMKGTAGADITSSEFQDAIPFDPDVPFSFAAGGENFITRTETRLFSGDATTTARYTLTGDLSANTTAGAQYFQNKFEEVACEGRVFPNDQATACDAAVSLRGFSNLRENVEVGAFLQHRFNWRDYLFVTGALRVDDNSALGEREDAIWSPSANFSFIVSQLPTWDVDFISSLRVRGAWGKASQSPSQFAADRTFVISRLARDGEVVAGLSPLDPGNQDLAAERNEEFEFGLNAGLLDDRLGLDLTYYDRTTTDAIILRPVAPSTGFANSQFVNIGELSNAGLEATLNADVLRRDPLNWSLRFSYSTTDPVITDLGQEGPIFLGFSQVLVEGAAPGAYVSRVIESAERDANGDIIPESIVYAEGTLGDDSGRRIVGQPTPTNTQSLSSTLTAFGTLRLYTLFERKGGNQLFVDALEDMNPGSLGGVNSQFYRTWAFRQTESTPVVQAMMEQDRLVGNHDDVWIHDAAFIKLREINLSYSLPTRLSARFGAEGTRIYAGGRNIFTATDFPGPWDPESQERGARDDLTSVVDNVLAPPLILFGGVEFTF